MGTIRVDLSGSARLPERASGGLADRSYDIVIKRGLLPEIGPRLKGLGFSGRSVLVTNPTVGKLYGTVVSDSLKAAGLTPVIMEVPDGEEFKTLGQASRLYDRLIEERMERGNPVIALGGGVIGDLAGFVAATYLRGVPLVQIPTTLLAQVDSSVGGKTAVDHPKGKNLIGAFYQPRGVFIDPDVLKTLDIRQLRAGLAEVVKYGIIRDERFFSFLEDSADKLTTPTGDELIKAIEKSCSIKAAVVIEDESEKGLRSILNFGHTFAHAIEVVTGYTQYSHGEAVSIGMALAAGFSTALGFCDKDVEPRIKGLLKALGLIVEPPALQVDEVVGAMRLDKKVSGGQLRFVLASAIGSVELKVVGEAEVRGFLSTRLGPG